MKLILAALAASTLLAAAPASAETFVTIPAEEYARLTQMERYKQIRYRRSFERQIEYQADTLPIGSSIWWQQMDREKRGGRR